MLSLLGSFLGGTINPTSQSVTNETDVAGTPPPGGIWAVIYDSNGPGTPQVNQKFNGPYVFDPTYGKPFGRFEVTTTKGQLVSVLYVVSTGSAGVTGSQAGLVGLERGTVQRHAGSESAGLAIRALGQNSQRSTRPVPFRYRPFFMRALD